MIFELRFFVQGENNFSKNSRDKPSGLDHNEVMRVAFIFGVVTQIGLACFLFNSHAQQAGKNPTRGDGLLAKLEEVEPELKKTFAALADKAESDDSEAQENVSRLLARGQGVAVDLKASFEWVEKSAQGGYGLGQIRLGRMYRFGTGTDPDEKKSNDFWN